MKVLCIVLTLLLPLSATALSTGIIAGIVEDAAGNPLTGATVAIEGTPFGAMTTPQGEYVIAGLSPGTYTVAARMVGRATSKVEMVVVEADNVSRIDFELAEDASGSTVILVTQSRTNILRDIPATAFQLDLSEMRTMSSSTIVDMIATQPGVVQQDGELHVRGGRAGEVDYVLDGISLRSPMDNRFNFDIPVSAVSNATLMTGGLSIEYGNTLSGIVDLIGKEGGDSFHGTISGRMGDATSSMISSGEQVFTESIDIDLCRKDLSSIELSLSGPEPITKSLLPSMGIDLPGEMTISASGQFSTSGKNNMDTRDNWSYNWLNDGSAMVKLSYRSVPRTIYSLNAVGSYREHGWNQWAWSRYGEVGIVEGYMYPPGSQDYALPAMFSETGGLIFNVSHLIGDRTSLKITLGTLRFQNWNRIYDQEGGFVGEGTNPMFWMTEYSPPQLFESQQGFFYDGVHQNVWHDSKATVSTALIGLDMNPNPRARLKAGISGKYYDLYQYNAYFLSPGNAYLSLWNAYPYSAAAYVQGSYRFTGGAITTAGVRGDYFNANTSVFSLEAGGGVPVEAKVHISPRFSISVPFSERSIFFTTFGHYFQMPPMNSLYLQTAYNCGAQRVIAGNPDLNPELTRLFEVGIRQELDRFTDLAISFYNKDITGLVSTEDHSEGTSYVFTNDNSHGNVRGIETSFSRMAGSNVSGQVFYTLSIAKGKYSSMLERYNYAQFGVVYVSREENYLDWDQSHQAGTTVEYTFFGSEGPEIAGVCPFENSSVAVSWKYGSGTPYSLPPATGELLVTNSERRPFTMQTDITVSRDFSFGSGNIKFMAGIFNLFNRKNITHIYETALFHTSGDPTGEMGNPRAWSPARHLLFSAVVSW
ncbi:MAG: TonB-dependent receptor [Candidatus Sabulitectum sp.]|nr:TonB-dependent receptor [Candidatus Sabulitectum sp.]